MIGDLIFWGAAIFAVIFLARMFVVGSRPDPIKCRICWKPDCTARHKGHPRKRRST